MSKDDSPILPWIVDVQNDFVRPDGRLYVKNPDDPSDPGAAAAMPAITTLVRRLQDQGGPMVFTADWHRYGDPEIDTENPDFLNTFPPHCMALSDNPDEATGADLPPELGVEFDREMSRDLRSRTEAYELGIATARKKGCTRVQKSQFSVFTGNSQISHFLDGITAGFGQKPGILIAGVALDVCVRHAVEGFLERGFNVYVLREATWGLGIAEWDELEAAWNEMGGVSTSDPTRAP